MQHHELLALTQSYNAQQKHLDETLERHPIINPASLPKRIADRGLKQEQRQLRHRQADLFEMGEARAVECLEEAIRAVENARELLAGSER